MEMVPELPPHLDIYKASAGSGKTFLLTVQYLKLLLQSPLAYREILAVTFTNKATEEMKQRILGELKSLAQGKTSEYGSILLEFAAGMTAADLQQQAIKTYSAILHDYSRFAISTIDSFVQKIIRSFAYEIGLDAGFKLQLNTDLVKDDLTERLYRLLDSNEPLKNWVVEMAITRLSEGKNWDFKTDMIELAGELFKERFQDFNLAMSAFSEEERTAAFTKLKNKVYAANTIFEKEQCRIATEAVDLVAANGIDIVDFHYGKAGFVNHFYKAVSGNFCEAGSRVKEFLSKPEKAAASKAHPDKKQAIGMISAGLHAVMQRLVDHYDNNINGYYTAQAIRQNLYTLQLMQVFNDELSNYRSENNALLISDTHLLLRQLSQENDASFIFEKTGNRFQHFLIDEFQDTSVFQWDNFKPLLGNALSEGNYNLVVGDVKQAIYRWRSGDWRLLLKEVKKQLGFFQVKENSLQQNFRSAKPIIDFNNYLFNTIPARLQEKFNQDMLQAPDDIYLELENNGYLQIITDAYADSYQEIPAKAADDGIVNLYFIDEETDEQEQVLAFTDKVLQLLPLQIEELINEYGYTAKDITILTRGNYEARQVMQCLMTHQQQQGTTQYAIISADALLIGSNQAIQMMLSAMRWLVNESDTLSRAFLIKSIAARQKSNLSHHQLYAGNGSGKLLLPDMLLNARIVLQSLPVIELVNKLINLLALDEYPADQSYLVAFLDIVLEWNRFGEDGLLAFISFWDEEAHKKSLPAGKHADAVEVMTIHKSKGLAFNVLVLPFCNWALEPDSKKNNWLWVDTGATDFSEVPVVPVKYKKDLASSNFAYAFFEEQLLSQMDSLNMLYVALTRARTEILAFAPLPKKDYKIKTVGDLVYDMFKSRQKPGNPAISNVSESFESGSVSFGARPSKTKQETGGISQKGNIYVEKMIFADWRNRLSIRPASALPDEDYTALPRSRGILFHQVLSAMQNPADLPKVLEHMEMQGVLNKELKDEMKIILEKLLTNEVLAGWVSNSMSRISERDIVTSNGQLKRPDIILMNSHETIVIDFKFTEGSDSHLKNQVREYVKLLHEMGFKNVRGFLLYGLFNSAEAV